MIEAIGSTDTPPMASQPAHDETASVQEQADAAFARGDYGAFHALSQRAMTGPEPSPTPGPTPKPQASEPSRWTPQNEAQVKADIQGALNRHHGNIEQAFADLRDQRQQPQNYYDSNLAIAADYLRARWDVQRHGTVAEAAAVETYLLAKRTVGVPQEGPGPVSPYSDLEAKYMRKGVADEAAHQSFWDNLKWATPVPVINLPLGMVKAGFDLLRGVL